jgi:hypothetical protein
MTSENQWNRIANEDVLVVDDKSWLRTKRSKALLKLFDELHGEWMGWKPEKLIHQAWWIYLVQILKDAVFETDINMHPGWIPENFTKLPFDKEEGRVIFGKFMAWFTGECAGDVYKMDEDTAETVQAGMYEVAKDWFKYLKKENRGAKEC